MTRVMNYTPWSFIDLINIWLTNIYCPCFVFDNWDIVDIFPFITVIYITAWTICSSLWLRSISVPNYLWSGIYISMYFFPNFSLPHKLGWIVGWLVMFIVITLNQVILLFLKILFFIVFFKKSWFTICCWSRIFITYLGNYIFIIDPIFV